MKGIIKNILEDDLGRVLTADEAQIVDEHTYIISELFKLEKRRKELEEKIVKMKDISIKLPD